MIIPIILLIIWSIIDLYLCIRARERLTQNLDTLYEQHRQQIIDRTIDLQSVYDVLKIKYDQIEESYEKETQRLESLKETTENQERLLDQSYSRKKALLESQLAQEIEQKKQIYQVNLKQLEEDIETHKEELAKFSAMMESVNQAVLRAKQIKEKENFYSIVVPEKDRADIVKLQSMNLQLNNHEVIPKLIWEIFLRRPTQEMLKRVIAGKDISGIYKITNKETQEAYIGKSTNIATRWQNHVKTAIGMGAAAQSTLHTRLETDGVWNYTFEIIEEVDKDHLSEREAYYIDLFGTKKQLNMKSGDKHGTE